MAQHNKPRVPSSIYTDSIYTRQSSISSRDRLPFEHPSQQYSLSPSSQSLSLSVPVPASRTTASLPAITTAPNGILLLAIVAKPNPMLKEQMRTFLSRGNFNEVVIVGSKGEESAIKQVKMDMYALAGSMSRELGVQMHLMPSWDDGEVGTLVSSIVGENGTPEVKGVVEKTGKRIKGVLCDPDVSSGTLDVLELSSLDLEADWRFSVGFVHAVARQTIPRLVETAQLQDDENNLIFAVATTSQLSLNGTALTGLLTSLSNIYSKGGLEVGYAEQLLIPEPEVETLTSSGKPTLAPTDGWQGEIEEFAPGESPTKLWNMWSMQNELDGF